MGRLLRRALCFLALALALPLGAAAGYPTIGLQPLLVIPVEYAHAGCPPDKDGVPTCPRNTAAQLQQLLQPGLNNYYNGPATGFKLTWQVRVLVNPDTSTGWWPAPSKVSDLEAAAKKPNFNNFTYNPSAVRDAATTVVSQALQRGVITPAELSSYRRLVTVHNWHVFSGQSSGYVPITYTAAAVLNNLPTIVQYSVTAAFVNEGTGDQEMVNVMQHELGHELGPGDFYASPCPLRAPDDPPYPPPAVLGLVDDNDDCVSRWDIMGGTPSTGSNVAFGYYSRSLLGWVSTDPPQVRYEPGSFSGPVSLSSLEYPNGDPLALHIPDDPGRLVLARAFGQSGFFQGFLVECRRTPWDDPLATPVRGASISYIDSTLTDRKQVFARFGYSYAPKLLRQNGRFAALTFPLDTFFSTLRGFSIEFRGFNSRGGCDLYVNRPVPPLGVVTLGPVVGLSDPTRITAFGGAVPRSVYANPGVVLNGPKLPVPKKIAQVGATDAAASRAVAAAAVARRAVRVSAPARGAPSTIRFTYGNVGGATGGATATVRVQQPWVASPPCGAAASPPAGRVIARVRLPRLASGAAGTAVARWRPRSGEAAGITVSFQSPGQATPQQGATTVLAFQTHRRGRRGAAPEMRTRIVVAVPRTCAGPVNYRLAPAILPRGWRARFLGAGPVAPGQRRVVTIGITAPRRGAAATDIPIAVVFSQPEGDAPAESPAGSLPLAAVPAPRFTTGIDVLARVNAGFGRPAPAFVLPAPAGMAAGQATPPTTNPNTGSPEQPQTIAITACSTPALPNPVVVNVTGTLSPARPSAPITLTYTANPGTPQQGQVVTHQVMTDAAGGSFQDAFDRQSSAWTAVARTDPVPGFAAATSAPCAVMVP